jgi:hypothetical protein
MHTRIPLLAVAAALTLTLSACAAGEVATGPPITVTGAPNTPTGPVAAGDGVPGVTESVAAAARAFLAGLPPERREQALHDVDDPALREWSYFPSRDDRNGVALEDLDPAQRDAAFAVAEAVLSEDGYRQMREVLAAEDALGVRNGESGVNSGRYFLAFFGDPAAGGRFTVQLNGHHLAVNSTYDGNRVSPTPAFTGVDPVRIDLGGQEVRPMRAEAEAVAGLLGSMDDAQLDAARIGRVDDVRVGTGATTRFPTAEGTPVSDLTPEQVGLVETALRAWVGDTDERVADRLTAEYRAEFDRTRIAWTGSTDPDVPGSYLRLDGPRLWIEFSNVGRFGNGDNHYHSVYRDKQNDYLTGA